MNLPTLALSKAGGSFIFPIPANVAPNIPPCSPVIKELARNPGTSSSFMSSQMLEVIEATPRWAPCLNACLPNLALVPNILSVAFRTDLATPVPLAFFIAISATRIGTDLDRALPTNPAPFIPTLEAMLTPVPSPGIMPIKPIKWPIE